MTNITKESAYLLGYIWGDGCLAKNYYRITIDTTDDFLLPILEKTGRWNCYTRIRKNWKKSYMFYASSKTLHTYLHNYDYRSKFNSASKIINTIPDHLKHYWFRGLSDADGCFYIKKPPNQLNQFSIAGPYDQNWDFIENLFKQLNIKYTIKQQIYKTHKSSIIRTTNKQNILDFGNYIYQDYDCLGLYRKYEKFSMLKK